MIHFCDSQKRRESWIRSRYPDTLTSWLGTKGLGTGREGGPPHPAVMGASPASAIALKPQAGRLAEP